MKSVFHDATPSWNGFNYQGKVGIYVCLKMINDFLNTNAIGSPKLVNFLDEHAIQYEWIEDFSILKGEKYISHHQVKHKADSAFSTHIDALVTIRNRNKQILSTTDLLKYIDPMIEIPENDENSGEKILDKDSYLSHKILTDLIKKNCLGDDWRLNKDWRNEVEDNFEYYTCLEEFETFSSNSFDGAKIYFHTTEIVSEPTKNISDYNNIPEYLIGDFSGKTKLIDLQTLSIFIGNSTSDFELVLNDKNLEAKIKEIIDSILKKIHSNEQYSQFSETDKDIYFTKFLNIINQHLIERHENIRQKQNIGDGFKETRPKIAFVEVWNEFNKIYHEENKDYFESRCQRKFKIAYDNQLEELLSIYERKKATEPHVAQVYHKRYITLKKHHDEVLNKKYSGKYRDLLREISPHIFIKKYSNKDFYELISETNLIENIYLDFLAQISKNTHEKSILFYNQNSDGYYPTIVNFDTDDINQCESKILKFQSTMKSLSDNYEPNQYLQEAKYLVVKIKSDFKDILTDKTIQQPKITDVDYNYKSSITNTDIYLKSLKDAIEEINND